MRDVVKQVQGVIFDMDGTLVEPLLDFAAIRRQLAIAPQEGILEAIEHMPAPRRDEAHRTLLDMELAAARQATLMPGAVETLTAIRRAGLKTALLTRNAPEAMAVVLERFPGLAFDATVSRGDGPAKPQPDGVLKACRQLGVPAERTVCVGDFLYDLLAARAAGSVSVLLATRQRPPYADQADYVITALNQLPDLLGIDA